jgi:hypothetical protein
MMHLESFGRPKRKLALLHTSEKVVLTCRASKNCPTDFYWVYEKMRVTRGFSRYSKTHRSRLDDHCY